MSLTQLLRAETPPPTVVPRFSMKIKDDEFTQTDLNTKIEKHFKRVK